MRESSSALRRGEIPGRFHIGPTLKKWVGTHLLDAGSGAPGSMHPPVVYPGLRLTLLPTRVKSNRRASRWRNARLFARYGSKWFARWVLRARNDRQGRFVGVLRVAVECKSFPWAL